MEKATSNLELILKYFPDFSPFQLKQLHALEGLYKDWNSKINVISRKDIDSLYERHVLHSLSIAAITKFKAGTEIIDIGTGGGFPGIPLAIFFPEVQFHLVDSIGKKLKVVEEVAKALGLMNISTQHTRVEEIKNRQFNYAISRAVAPLKDLWKWSKPLLKKNSLKSPMPQFVSQQSEAWEKETAMMKNQKAASKEIIQPGLICLKGGDLNQEIIDSGSTPSVIEIYDIFPEQFFRKKFLLYVHL